MQFDFFKGNETEQYMFYRVPQVLFTDEQFKKISCEAKLLYGFLIDRTSLSVEFPPIALDYYLLTKLRLPILLVNKNGSLNLLVKYAMTRLSE